MLFANQHLVRIRRYITPIRHFTPLLGHNTWMSRQTNQKTGQHTNTPTSHQIRLLQTRNCKRGIRYKCANDHSKLSSNTSNALLPFKCPMNLEPIIWVGMLTRICMWSGHTSPSIISIPLHWHSCLSISRIYICFSSKKYTLEQILCDTFISILCMLNYLCIWFLSSYINPPIVFLLLTGRSNPLYYNRRILSHWLTFWEPRDYRVVFIIQ